MKYVTFVFGPHHGKVTEPLHDKEAWDLKAKLIKAGADKVFVANSLEGRAYDEIKAQRFIDGDFGFMEYENGNNF